MKKGLKKVLRGAACLLMIFAAGCSSDGGSSGKGSVAGDSENGTVGISVTVDGTIKCNFCGKEYQKKAEALACQHYRCNVCDSAYKSAEEVLTCTDHITVTFADSEGVYEAEPQIIKAGVNPVVPSWTKENFTLSWSSEITAATENVTYTAIWTELPKCSNCGEHYATETAAANCAKIDGCPQFGKDNDWVAGDASPAAWLTGMTGTVSSDKRKVPYAAKNYKEYLKIKRDIAITVTPVMEGNITVYIAANKDSTDSNKTASATFNGAAVGSAYQLPAYNAVNPDPFVIPVTEEMVGKPVVITTSYEALWFAITLNE